VAEAPECGLTPSRECHELVTSAASRRRYARAAKPSARIGRPTNWRPRHWASIRRWAGVAGDQLETDALVTSDDVACDGHIGW